MSIPRISPVLLAGGSGSRLWPISRDAMPKQFLPLINDRSTYQEALLRVADRDLFAPPIVITAADFRFFARCQAEELGIAATIVLEPEARDSGPAVATAATLSLQRDPGSLVMTLAADHIIFDLDAFHSACRAARDSAMAGHIVTFGVPPSEPRTSYGYIRRGAPLAFTATHAVDAFVEKPDGATAARFIADGYLWNSGNLLFSAEVLLTQLNRYEPEMVSAVKAAVEQASVDLEFLRLAPVPFGRAPRKSIDYALMEKTDRSAVVEARFRWSDIGSWDAVYRVSERDGNGNVLHGPAVAHDSRDCLVQADRHLTAVLGLEGIAVVTTPDAVLVLPRSRAEDVKDLLAQLKARNVPEAINHRRVYRPWGHYEGVDQGERFQVKRIVVTPGSTLSLQKHMHRAEHWIVVRGTAEVTNGEQRRTVHENESTFIPLGAVHRLANPGRIPLELIEVQTGSYLGEDDIVRFEDVYGRN